MAHEVVADRTAPSRDLLLQPEGLGRRAISVPLLGQGQEICGALGLAFPEHLVSVSGEGALVDALHAAAARLSYRNGLMVYSLPGSDADSRRVAPARRKAKS